jgi:hypothetical protein
MMCIESLKWLNVVNPSPLHLCYILGVSFQPKRLHYTYVSYPFSSSTLTDIPLVGDKSSNYNHQTLQCYFTLAVHHEVAPLNIYHLK